MSSDENKALVRRAITQLYAGNIALVDEVFPSTFTTRPLWVEPAQPDEAEPEGSAREDIKVGITTIRAALPDVAVSIEEIVGDGDIVMMCYTVSGTHTGAPWMGQPATGRRVQWTSFNISRIVAGKITEERWLWDRLGVFQQMGVLPSQAELYQRMQGAGADSSG